MNINMKKSMTLNILCKPISMVLSILYTPLLLNYLGSEKYGVWATMLSIISWVNYFDIGIGQGLRNTLTEALAKNDPKGAQEASSTAYILLSLIATVVFVCLLILTFILNWNSIFNTNEKVQAAVAISFLFICVNFILGLYKMIYYALQRAEKVSFTGIAAQFLNLFGLILLINLTNASLVYVSILFGFTTFIVSIVSNIDIFIHYYFLIPKLSFFSKNQIKNICNLGLKFFLIQIAVLVMNTTDNILITTLFGPSEVTPYDAVYKVMGTGYGIYTALITPLWSRYTIAATTGDYIWIKKTLRKLNLLLIPVCIGYFILTIIFKPLAHVWLGKELYYAFGLIMITAIYNIFQIISGTYSNMLNGIGKIDVQLSLAMIQAIANIPLSYFLAIPCGMGVTGIILASCLLMAISAIGLPIHSYYILKVQIQH